MRISKLTILSAGVLLASAVQLSAQQRYYHSDGRIAISKEPLIVAGSVTRIDIDGTDTRVVIPPVMPPPPFRLVDYLDLSEQNMTYYIASRDTFQIRYAAMGVQKATDQRVRDLATVILRDRRNELNLVREIISENGDGVGTDPIDRDPELKRLRELVKDLDGMSAGPAWDGAYLRTVFFLHQNEIDVQNANHKNLHDDDFEKLNRESISSKTQTRDAARTIAQSLSVTLP